MTPDHWVFGIILNVTACLLWFAAGFRWGSVRAEAKHLKSFIESISDWPVAKKPRDDKVLDLVRDAKQSRDAM